MLIVNLFGGSNTGKSTHAHAIFSELKKVGLKVEFVREYCKDFFYEDTKYKLDNQMLVTGKQIEQIELFRKGGCEVVVTESPVLLGALYVKNNGFLGDAIRREHNKNDNYNIMLERDVPFDSFGRGSDSSHSDEMAIMLNMEHMSIHHRYKTTELVDYSKIVSSIKEVLDVLIEAGVVEELETECIHDNYDVEYNAEKWSHQFECRDCGHKKEISRNAYLKLIKEMKC